MSAITQPDLSEHRAVAHPAGIPPPGPAPERTRAARLANYGRKRARRLERDVVSRMRYGQTAPLSCQRIWIDPRTCDRIVRGFSRSDTGRVVDGDWDLQTTSVEESAKMRFARLHWDAGVPWSETGVFPYLLDIIEQRGPFDGCSCEADIVARYERLDADFERIRRERRFKTESEMRRRNFREEGGVYIHVGRDNTPLFGRGGCHRLAIARILDLPVIPAQLGIVHTRSLSTWPRLTQRPSTRAAEVGSPRHPAGLVSDSVRAASSGAIAR